MDPILLYVAAASVSGILLLGALEKLRNLAHFEGAVAAYALLPSKAVPAFAFIFPAAEITAGVLLLLPAGRNAGAALGVALLIAATAGVAINLLRGRRDIDCGCGGFSDQGAGLSWWLVARNGFLVTMALSLFLGQADVSRVLGWVDGLTFFGATLAVLGLYFSFNQLIDSHNRFQKT